MIYLIKYLILTNCLTLASFQISTIIGNDTSGSSPDGSVATSFMINSPKGVFYSNSLFVADSGNSQVRKVTNNISTIFSGEVGENVRGDDDQATSASFHTPFGIWGNPCGVIYGSDHGGHQIRIIAADGIVSTLAGTGVRGSTGNNGQATAADISNPRLISGDTNSNIYFTEQSHCTVRKVSSDGIITTIANLAGSTGNGGAATAAQLTSAYGVFVDSVGKVYVTEEHNIRTIDKDSKIQHFTG